MIVKDRCLPPALPAALAANIRKSIHGALGSVTANGTQCIVNDSSWRALRGAKTSPVVMNSATYLSKKFQAGLKADGWEIEHEAEEQAIDAFKTISLPFTGYYLDESGLRGLINDFWTDKAGFTPLVQHTWPFVKEPTIDQFVWWLTQMYYKRRIHDLSLFPAKYHHYFNNTGNVTHAIRVGVEFESGYTASAYRAFVKLNFFYAASIVDVGVFVATDKANATRIWPVSNRNVNYNELENRKYKRNIYFPIWEVLFAPDGFSQQVEYLGDRGATYLPTPTGATHMYGGVAKAVNSRGDGKLLIQV
jgi:hypothetical protein